MIEAIGAITFSIFFGIILPSVDTGTDIRLGVRLFLNGHPRWAMCVLGPVILNTLFTLIACRILEKKGKRGSFQFYICIPLVFLQVYPQYCAVRLIWSYFRGNIDTLSEYSKKNKSLEGGLGCLEPYIESVPQAYIQTAFFWIANSLTSTVERLCFNEKKRSCEEYDKCSEFNKCATLGFDNNNCDFKGFEPYEYKTDAEVRECRLKTNNCTLEFEKCIEPFYTCLQGCQTNLTEEIMQFDESELYASYAANNQDWINNTWVLNYEASKNDLKQIQLFLLFIGDSFIFLSTYAVSVFAATYGITKFFRLSHARFTGGFTSRSYWGTFLVTLIFVVGKGYTLAIMVLVHTRPLWQNTCWWALFAMGPPFVLALILLFWETCFCPKQTCCWIPKNYAFNMVFKQPPLLMAPCVTPFTYRLESKKKYMVSDDTGKLMKTSSIQGQFEVSQGFTILNCIITIVSTSAGLIWKGEQDLSTTILVTVLALIFLLGGLKGLFEIIEKENYKYVTSIRCIEHEKDWCDKCLALYGFSIENHATYEICFYHQNKLPCKGSRKHSLNEIKKYNLHHHRGEKMKEILLHPELLQKFKQILPQVEIISQSDRVEIENLTSKKLGDSSVIYRPFQKMVFSFLTALESKKLEPLIKELKGSGISQEAINAAKEGNVENFLKTLDKKK